MDYSSISDFSLLKALYFTLLFAKRFCLLKAGSDSVIMENMSHFAHSQGILQGLLTFQFSFNQINKVYFKFVLTLRSVWSTYCAGKESTC